ncbi:MAG: hypothetical protein JXR68_11750 [Bacteroidales bacterium]|nr:hypothetical protein [Bacteroidales bacterium]
MSLSNEELSQKCTLIKQVIDDGMGWVNQNAEEDKRQVTISDLKTYKRHISRYANALNKRPAIAIFGQSQVGKSYLVSNLAKTPQAYSLLVKVPGSGDEIDFIKNINPPGGGKEATGLVTRFTTSDNYQNGWKPFELKIFTQADLVCVIANGYFSDITHYTFAIDREKIQKKIQELIVGKDKSERTGLTEDDIYNIKEYLNDRFRDHFLIRDLNTINFWDDLAQVVPYIDPLERWKILEFLWGQQPFFTDLFKQLSQTLSQIKFHKSVRVDLDALTPQSDTILDVQRLREFFSDEKKPPVKLYDGATLLAEVDRSSLSALTAEVVMPLADETSEHPKRKFLKDADVLDFPGARSRQQIPEITFEEKGDEDKLLVFLRGKVAYLFDHYNINFEVSTLMFCQDDKQPEVTDLPKFLYDWISKVHGDSTQKREERERQLELLVGKTEIERIIPLLVVFTKFNIELAGNPATEQSGDLGPHNAKWTARIGANFADQMGISISDSWIEKWNNKGSFKNVFPLRDPKWSKAVYDGFDTEGKETNVKSEYVEKMKDMEKSWLNHTDVIKHIHNPLEAWKETTDLNKSGLDYIIKYMTPTTNPIIKREQINGRIEKLQIELASLLQSFYRGGTIDEKLQKARINAAQSFMQMMKMQKEKNSFGHLLNFLMLKENLSWKIFFDLMMQEQIDDTPVQQQDDTSDDKTIPIDLIEMLNQFIDINENDTPEIILSKLKEYFAIDDDATLKEVMQQSGINIETLLETHKSDEKPQNKYDKSYIFAKKLLSAWLSHINDLKNDKFLDDFGIQKNIAELLLEELNKSKNRVNLKKIIADTTREHIKMFQLTSNVDIVARVSANVINKFVNTFGWVYETSDKRPKIKKTDTSTIFAEMPVKAPAKKDLKLGIEFPGELQFVQWSTGLRSSFEANVYFEEDVKDPEQAQADAKLGVIIQKLN